MITIWKYQLSPIGNISVNIPEFAEILSVGGQDNTIVLWALVDTDRPCVITHFNVVGTGWEIKESTYCGKFIGTATLKNGLVFHVFKK